MDLKLTLTLVASAIRLPPPGGLALALALAIFLTPTLTLAICPHQVSRIQAIVKCSNDGAVLSSEGRGPTLWRMPGGQWNALYRGGTHLLNDGDQISLDCYDPEAAVFMCLREGGYAQQQQDQQYGYAQQQQGGYDQQQGGYQQQGQQSQGQLPYGWEQLMDQNSGHVYYSNSQTGQTQWEPPQ